MVSRPCFPQRPRIFWAAVSPWKVKEFSQNPRFLRDFWASSVRKPPGISSGSSQCENEAAYALGGGTCSASSSRKRGPISRVVDGAGSANGLHPRGGPCFRRGDPVWLRRPHLGEE